MIPSSKVLGIRLLHRPNEAFDRIRLSNVTMTLLFPDKNTICCRQNHGVLCRKLAQVPNSLIQFEEVLAASAK